MGKVKILKELNRYKIDTCAEMIYRNALFYPDRECIIFGNTRLTFGEYNTRVNRLANALTAMGLKKGDVIGILSWNSAKFLEVTGAAMKGGFIYAPLHARLNEKELGYLVNNSRAKVLFVGEEQMAMARNLRSTGVGVEKYVSMDVDDKEMISYDELLSKGSSDEPEVMIEADDPVLIMYTSGTTGLPRGAVYTHRGWIGDHKTYVMATSIQPEDKYLMIMPLFHIGGTKVMWAYFYVGGSIVVLPAFDAEITLKVIQEEKVTDIHVVPTHLPAFWALPSFKEYDLSSLKRMWYAASPMPLEMLKHGLDLWGPIFIQGYGSTETGPVVCCLRTEDHKVQGLSEEEQKRLKSCGRPGLGVHVRIVNDAEDDVEPFQVGEIIIAGNTAIGFWQKPEETAARIRGGFTYTGDMGYYDEKGYIYIVDRKNDMIITGGENVYPREVEEVVYAHPAIKEAAVIGVPDEKWVERVHAVVACKEGQQITDKELIDFCRARIAKFKAPKSVDFVQELPKNPAGKILKRELRALYEKK
ncbi:MAG: Long-chain-fatty-acid--CoA ligase FadD13 [Syntrophorhabdus sp. PtaU1.Bin050]|nr:MAG: Long-chain-fatty-acid--CoA ligase FadD13 [Syntrophorhabdus sp. PtaU1.Bin050]